MKVYGLVILPEEEKPLEDFYIQAYWFSTLEKLKVEKDKIINKYEDLEYRILDPVIKEVEDGIIVNKKIPVLVTQTDFDFNITICSEKEKERRFKIFKLENMGNIDIELLNFMYAEPGYQKRNTIEYSIEDLDLNLIVD